MNRRMLGNFTLQGTVYGFSELIKMYTSTEQEGLGDDLSPYMSKSSFPRLKTMHMNHLTGPDRSTCHQQFF